MANIPSEDPCFGGDLLVHHVLIICGAVICPKLGDAHELLLGPIPGRDVGLGDEVQVLGGHYCQSEKNLSCFNTPWNMSY